MFLIVFLDVRDSIYFLNHKYYKIKQTKIIKTILLMSYKRIYPEIALTSINVTMHSLKKKKNNNSKISALIYKHCPST